LKDIWKSLAIDELTIYPAKKEAMTTIPERLRELESAFVSIGSPSADKVAVQGGGGNDKALNNIVQRESLFQKYTEVVAFTARVERGLAVLTDEENEILSRCYIHPERGAVERIANARGLDKSTVYRMRDDALRKFTIAMYG
jgi:hypothetical protein